MPRDVVGEACSVEQLASFGEWAQDLDIGVEAELAHEGDVVIVLGELLEEHFELGADHTLNVDLVLGFGLPGPADADIGLSTCILDMRGMCPR